MLVASITSLDELEKVRDLADLVEFRLDYFQIQKRPDVPCIFTFRKKAQGGVSSVREEERLCAIEKALELGPDYCDLEADTDAAFIAKLAARFPKVKLIGSYHNFHETPIDLAALLQGMKNPHFSIYKIAVMAATSLDMLRLMLFIKTVDVPLSAISMGELGAPSRLLAKVMGSALDYAGWEEDLILHRYSLQTLCEVFHYRKLTQETKVYALIGNPVAGSVGHLFHNPRFSHDAVYVKILLVGEEVPEFFKVIKKMPFGGLSVTMPLKEAALLEMDQVDAEAQKIGAINTVVFREGRSLGSNTDGMGAMNALEKHVAVRGKRIAVLGAGGSARAIVYEALKRGAFVDVYNRGLLRAEGLAQEFRCNAYDIGSWQPFDIVINTIPKSEVIPPLHRDHVVMDVNYTPKQTVLLLQAKKIGSVCVYGEEMFVEQALLQQMAWVCSELG